MKKIASLLGLLVLSSQVQATCVSDELMALSKSGNPVTGQVVDVGDAKGYDCKLGLYFSSFGSTGYVNGDLCKSKLYDEVVVKVKAECCDKGACADGAAQIVQFVPASVN
ncbi:MAG: hypothetical protein R3208_15120 [Ketobacteraceae bacterium]|nr:hypothetical protein [Ketobacteraceae bacterium]